MSIASIGMAVLVGCSGASSKPDTSKLVWPAPPDEPRIRFVAEYRGQADFEDNRLKAALVGSVDATLTLDKPYGVGVSIDRKRMYVTDTRMKAVVVFDFAQKKAGVLQTDSMGALRSPIEVRIDSRGRVYVTDSVQGRLNVYTPEGKTILSLGKTEELTRPTGLALDEARNRIYVADTQKHRILTYDFEGKFLTAFGERGSDPGQFNYPVNLAVDKAGLVYVVDSGNFRVQAMTGEGEYVSTFGGLGDTPGTMARPKGVAIDSEGNVYVADAAFNNFQIFNSEGRILLFVGALGRGPGMFWLPTGIFIDPQDRIYVVDSTNARVQVFERIKGGSPEGGAPIEAKNG